MERLFENFWNEKFWLPENLTWKDLEPGFRDGITYRKYNDLLWSIPLIIVIIALRICCIKYLFTPLGHFLQIKSKKGKAPFENKVLEKMYRKCNKSPTDMELVSLMKQTDISQRDIERWWRKRKAHDRPTSLEKFGEHCWHFLFYSLNLIFGLTIFWNKTWMWNFIETLIDYPKHSLENGLWWYYNITLAFYTSQTFLHFFETRRKDFWQMFIHHILTVALIIASWILNIIRGGSVVVMLHDTADVFLEGTKIFKCAKYEKLASFSFVLFALVWIITRLGIFLKHSYITFFEIPKHFPPYPIYYIMLTMHTLLFTMHIMWTYVIIKITIKLICVKNLEDVRSRKSEHYIN